MPMNMHVCMHACTYVHIHIYTHMRVACLTGPRGVHGASAVPRQLLERQLLVTALMCTAGTLQLVAPSVVEDGREQITSDTFATAKTSRLRSAETRRRGCSCPESSAVSTFWSGSAVVTTQLVSQAVHALWRLFAELRRESSFCKGTKITGLPF